MFRLWSDPLNRNKNYIKKNNIKKSFYLNHLKDSRKKHLKSVVKSFWATLLSRFTKKNRQIKFTSEIKEQWVCNAKPLENSVKPIITWIGQATFLIQINNINILTDPVFGSAGFGFRRNFDAGISLKDLPKIDYVLISHNHQDHVEVASIEYLKKFDPIYLVPKGNKSWLKKRKIQKVIEFIWGQDKTFFLNSSDFAEIKFNFLPAYHWSGRGAFSMNKSLWGSWMIESNGTRIYFAGDSAYDEHYKKIGEQFKDIDIALMPIGPNEPEQLVIHSHLNTEQSGQAFLDLNAKNFIPMHWGTFRLGFDNFDAPIKRLVKWWDENKELVKNRKLHVVKFGQPLNFDNFLVDQLSTHLEENIASESVTQITN